MNLLAVYGSFIPGYVGQQAAGVDLKIVGPCVIKGDLFLFPSQDHPGRVFPGLTMGEGKVEGMLLEVPNPEVMRRIDLFEGWDSRNHFFCGSVRRRATLSEPQVEAFVYLFPHRRRVAPLESSWPEYCASPGFGPPVFIS